MGQTKATLFDVLTAFIYEILPLLAFLPLGFLYFFSVFLVVGSLKKKEERNCTHSHPWLVPVILKLMFCETLLKKTFVWKKKYCVKRILYLLVCLGTKYSTVHFPSTIAYFYEGCQNFCSWVSRFMELRIVRSLWRADFSGRISSVALFLISFPRKLR